MMIQEKLFFVRVGNRLINISEVSTIEDIGRERTEVVMKNGDRFSTDYSVQQFQDYLIKLGKSQ